MDSKLFFITKEDIMKKNLVLRKLRTISLFLLSNTADKPHVVGRYIMYSYRKLSQQQLPPVVYSNSGLAFALGPPAEKSCPTPPAASNLTRPTPIFYFRELHQPTSQPASYASPINSHQFSAAKPVAPTPQEYALLPNKASLLQSIKCQMQRLMPKMSKWLAKNLVCRPCRRTVTSGRVARHPHSLTIVLTTSRTSRTNFALG
ncbi:hypothetical protein J3E68DRAFT_236980 [Trichoderma sp. SZMC 28012]